MNEWNRLSLSSVDHFALFWISFFLFISPENVPTRNSDVDYRFLEAAKAGDLDTVQVSSLSVCSCSEGIIYVLLRLYIFDQKEGRL